MFQQQEPRHVAWLVLVGNHGAFVTIPMEPAFALR